MRICICSQLLAPGNTNPARNQRLAAPKFNSETSTSTRIFCSANPSTPNGSKNDLDKVSKPRKNKVMSPTTGMERLPSSAYKANGAYKTSESTNT
mmetsp:Transcript_38268/g.57298  ORF Transcript_38268/g.57298 Transcript_38268/m.57298 type:complete len:95 (-) Transcript_38268:789-1073(-)